MKILYILLPLLFITVYHASAEQYGISLSRSCQIIIINNMTGCPTYEQLNIPFPDNTNPALGEFKVIDGMWKRDQPILKAPEKYYKYYTGDIIWLDPPQSVRKNIKMISIEPSIPEYKLGDESTKMNDYTISFGKDRYINSNCSEIKVTARNWLFMTGDAMTLLKHNCDMSYSSFNHIITIQKEKTYQDIATSYKWKLDMWIKENMEKCKARNCK